MATANERIASLETELKAHKDQCVTDKQELKNNLSAINSKLWAGLVLILFQFIGLAGYLAVKGTPWNNHSAAEVAGR